MMSSPSLRAEPAQIISSHPDVMADVPVDPFVLADLPTDAARDLAQRLSDTNAMRTELASTEQSPPDVMQYELTTIGEKRRNEIVGTGYRPLPCDHVGISNIDNEHYECCYDPCEKVFGRAEVNLDA